MEATRGYHVNSFLNLKRTKIIKPKAIILNGYLLYMLYNLHRVDPGTTCFVVFDSLSGLCSSSDSVPESWSTVFNYNK